ncbi:hypothetical protein E4U57_007151 [Claviceps arundinis]|uniref:G-protein coupled receptors family 2 profile 2 domain-containing protein n=1 Tax=Claviceps arundinis TaxID=1623583 RepID=A0A9P7MN70_9HYPO|nr:hypothetical protein E4U56_004962 [Claviceps arundinis]KAG5968204.1 hypothetical protein E4U57_007151 [Claviceps arundinis]
MTPAMALKSNDRYTRISTIEWACSSLSLLGCLFIIVTFCYSTAFHKPINRLVFYASFGNLFTVVGTLMSRSYLQDIDSFGCQFQASLIQLFLPADAFWTLAMAINVYLTFYFKFDASRLRRMEIPYLIGCYGLPAIPAVAFLFIKSSEGVRVYGNATLWCWISQDWDVLRIAVFYGPVWVVIFLTFFIYLRAGRTIYEKRKQLRGFNSSDADPMSFNGETVTTTRTTEVIITTEVIGQEGFHLDPLNPRDPMDIPGHGTSIPNGVYSVHITADSTAFQHGKDDAIMSRHGSAAQQAQFFSQNQPRKAATMARRRNHELNNAAWSYTKCSILFFTAIIITWIPSSANRVFSLVHDKDTSLPLEYMSAFVLPLQGFWNAIIYATTSWSACKELWDHLKFKKPSGWPAEPNGKRRQKRSTRLDARLQRRSQFVPPAGSTKTYSSESTTELASVRPHSADASYQC